MENEMTTAFERKLVSETQLHNEWQREIDRRDEIIASNKEIIFDLHASVKRLEVKLSQLRLELDHMTRQRDIALEWVDQP